MTVPTWRLDVEREIDLLEELARIYGYNKFPNTLPSFAGAVIALPDEPKLKITASIGVGLSDPADASWEEIYKRADEALYEAKRGGRNRVVVAENTATQPQAAERA